MRPLRIVSPPPGRGVREVLAPALFSTELNQTHFEPNLGFFSKKTTPKPKRNKKKIFCTSLVKGLTHFLVAVIDDGSEVSLKLASNKLHNIKHPGSGVFSRECLVSYYLLSSYQDSRPRCLH